MAALQGQGLSGGGQVLYSLVDDDWHVVPEVAGAVRDLVTNDPNLAESIRLGGHVVLAGNAVGIGKLENVLPARQVGKREFPVRLAGHGPFHTPFSRVVAVEARHSLGSLPFRAPRIPLIDGRGAIHTPWSADPEVLRDYTLGQQVTEVFDFTASVRVALREFAPDVVVCLPPGNTLSAPVAHVLIAERWRGIADRAGFLGAQADAATRLIEAPDVAARS
jgi:malonyl CoA-acyl carrier protein transacylase